MLYWWTVKLHNLKPPMKVAIPALPVLMAVIGFIKIVVFLYFFLVSRGQCRSLVWAVIVFFCFRLSNSF